MNKQNQKHIDRAAQQGLDVRIALHVDARRFGRQIDRGTLDARHFAQGFFDPANTRGTGHAAHRNIDDTGFSRDRVHAICLGKDMLVSHFETEPPMNHLFTVEGMTCGHCEKAVTQALVTVDPQAQVIIDRGQKSVSVESEQTREVLRQAITEEGYRVQD